MNESQINSNSEFIEVDPATTNYSVIKLNHSARYTIGDWAAILEKTTTMRQFIDKMVQSADNYKVTVTKDADLQSKIYNKYTGDTFEAFVELFIKLHGTDRRIGIHNYKPVNIDNGDEDLGVDATGTGTNGKPATVQAKFRINMKSSLSANEDHLSNFVVSSWHDHGVDMADTENMLIVTTCSGLHHKTHDKMLKGKVRCINLAIIEKFVNHNENFWNEFRRMTKPIILTKKELVCEI